MDKELDLLLLNINTKKIWEIMCDNRMIGYIEIQELSNLRKSTCFDALKRLEKAGFVERITGKTNGKRGRPRTVWRLTELGEKCAK